MSDKSLIIIGAGLAGLSAGCYARMNGYRTRIVEHNKIPGGVAAAWRKDGYLFDGGIHFMMGARPGSAESKLFDDLGVPLQDKVVPMKVYGRYLDENKGRRIDLTQDLDKFGLDLKAYSGEDTEVIEGLIAAARKLQGMDLGSMGMTHPPELAGITGRLKDMWSMRRVLKVFTGKFGKSVEEMGKDIKDPWLRELLKNLFLPCVPVWFLAMILALLADGRLGYLECGSQDFVQGIARKYQEMGGEVAYEATVEEILVEDGRAVGVALAGGETLRADAVISAADGHGTIFKLLGGRFADKKTRQRYASWKLTPSGLIFTFGVAREFPEEIPLTTINLMHPLTVAGRKVGGMLVRIFNYSSNFAPPGKSVIQVELEEPDFEYWHELQARNHGQYNEEKERLTSDILSRLEKHYPGLSAKVEAVDVATPHTIWRYTLNHKGAAMAWLPTTEFFKTPLPRTLPGLKNFCMAGQWVMGGGVVPALYSGRHAVQILCHQDGKVFQPEE
jgi:phytoene dehydrogenase-like protein